MAMAAPPEKKASKRWRPVAGTSHLLRGPLAQGAAALATARAKNSQLLYFGGVVASCGAWSAAAWEEAGVRSTVSPASSTPPHRQTCRSFRRAAPPYCGDPLPFPPSSFPRLRWPDLQGLHSRRADRQLPREGPPPLAVLSIAPPLPCGWALDAMAKAGNRVVLGLKTGGERRRWRRPED